ncbi:glutamate--cysteine ligase [Streptomyces sp. DH8]|uniref:glutamate--cysteine ligase 2 n=1 Tax=Streptomyces sp. DH8 TaxID=2857008 RepID=UPI001E3DB28A|nr:glutamate--cysteine ligase [Streptomyces sp. DH8]
MVRTVGVEEELLLVDAASGEARALSSAVLAIAEKEAVGESAFESELHRQQLEFSTHPCSDMGELGASVRRWRAEAVRHAAEAGASVAALATSPLPVSPEIGTGERYRWLAEHFGLTAQEQLTCGCHVHVSVESDEEGVAVLDRIRGWLPVLLALSANSPFWQGKDSGYSSYRSRVWGRWPSAGPVGVHGSAAAYHAEVRSLVATGVLRDEGMVYFDARLSHRYPTVEVRVADVCLDPADTVLLATLVRGLVETAAREWRSGRPAPDTSVGLLRVASWRAGRSGLDDRLIHPATLRPEPVGDVLRALMDHVRDALKDSGDLEAAEKALADVERRGNGARIQREILARTGSLRETVAECVRISAGEPATERPHEPTA